jgi:hypothetical protein
MQDEFELLLRGIEAVPNNEDALTELAQAYAYVFPDEQVLEQVAKVGPLVEMGAGTGYWANRLLALGSDVIAYDQAPPNGEESNRYHHATHMWSNVLLGDQTFLLAHPDRALFLCWPPLFSSLGDSLSFYEGDTVALIGDGGQRTARVTGLDDLFQLEVLTPAHALMPTPEAPATLSIWKRR